MLFHEHASIIQSLTSSSHFPGTSVHIHHHGFFLHPVVNCPDIESKESFAAHIGQMISVRLGADIGEFRHLMDAFGIDIRKRRLEHVVQRVFRESDAEELGHSVFNFPDKGARLAGDRV